MHRHAPGDGRARRRTASRHWVPTDALLLGEQHDAPEHHRIELETVQVLVARGQLAALALEMADDGASTANLPASATEARVRTALVLQQDKGWPWEDYAPAVMSAVRAGVPVIGANLPRSHMKDAMADVSLDVQLTDAARAQQQEAVRSGHCDLLPAAQIVPMTRIQIARDRSMAQVVVKSPPTRQGGPPDQRQRPRVAHAGRAAAHSDRREGGVGADAGFGIRAPARRPRLRRDLANRAAAGERLLRFVAEVAGSTLTPALSR